MSRQQSAMGSVPMRVSKPVSWLRDLPIWTKLGLIMIVPTLATIIVGTTGLLDHVDAANNADRARTLVVLSGDAGNLVHALQDERTGAAQLLDTPPGSKSTVATITGEYKKLQAFTDAAVAKYHQSRSTLADVPDNLRPLLDEIEMKIGEMPALRAQITDLTKISGSDAETTYRALISDLLSIRDIAGQLTGDTTLTQRLRAAGAVASAKEFLARERVVVLNALADRQMSPALQRALINTQAGQELAVAAFNKSATPDQSRLYERTVTGPDLNVTVKDEKLLNSLAPGQDPNAVLDPADWDKAMGGRSDLMKAVETQLNGQAQAAAIDLGARVQRQVLLETGLLLLTLLLGVLFAWLVARSMARSLRDLRQGALAVAQYGLPQAVARLRDPALSTNLSPAGVALQIAEPLPVRSNDEFGQVTEAFNAVHLEAVRTAAEQAALRASVATMFVNLARRSQILVDRLIGHLDRLERGEQDPDRLSELFQLDHLATRMRRNDENLLVLAGADSTRIQREPAALMDVLRAAQSEVEHYTRIEFGVIDQDIEVAAHAVNDLVHLVAELFDNATAFSPPDTTITVEARRLGDRAVLQVEDRGIGMSPEQYAELNERLATPPMVDVAVSRMMGLVVVARLAARHGVKTELRAGQERGTIADVLMPAGVLVPRALSGRGQMPTGFPAVSSPMAGPALGPAHPTPTRPTFPAPLALESGPSWAGNGQAGPWGQPNGAPAPAWGASPTPSLWDPAPAGANGGPGYFGGGYAGPGHPGAQTPGPGFGQPPGQGFGQPPGRSGPPAGGGGLGAALAGGLDSRSAGPGRPLPAWHDLTGAGPEPPASPPHSETTLPQRRPQWAEESGASPARQVAPPEHWSTSSGSASSTRPPTWPPVVDEAEGMPSLPENLTASLDMTSELPRMRAAGEQTGFGAPGSEEPARYSNDMTQELPIFTELESAWFHATPMDAPASPAPGWPPTASGEPVRANTGDQWSEHGAGTSGDAMAGSARSGAGTRRTEGASGVTSEVSWRSAADEGWRAAEAAAEPHDAGSTDMGLPRRVPMAQLVPGGVDSVGGGSDRRSPESVRGLLSAYHRGVQRGREAHGGADDSEAGPQSSGREQEA